MQTTQPYMVLHHQLNACKLPVVIQFWQCELWQGFVFCLYETPSLTWESAVLLQHIVRKKVNLFWNSDHNLHWRVLDVEIKVNTNYSFLYFHNKKKPSTEKYGNETQTNNSTNIRL